MRLGVEKISQQMLGVHILCSDQPTWQLSAYFWYKQVSTAGNLDKSW